LAPMARTPNRYDTFTQLRGATPSGKKTLQHLALARCIIGWGITLRNCRVQEYVAHNTLLSLIKSQVMICDYDI
jgi:hypothetical protein